MLKITQIYLLKKLENNKKSFKKVKSSLEMLI